MTVSVFGFGCRWVPKVLGSWPTKPFSCDRECLHWRSFDYCASAPRSLTLPAGRPALDLAGAPPPPPSFSSQFLFEVRDGR